MKTIAAVALVLAFTGTAAALTERPALQAAAVHLAGPVTVQCASSQEVDALVAQWNPPCRPLGWSFPEARQVFLGPRVCTLLNQPTRPGYAEAVQVFAHELGHVALQTRNELRVECYSLRHARAVARALGHPLTARQWSFVRSQVACVREVAES